MVGPHQRVFSTVRRLLFPDLRAASKLSYLATRPVVATWVPLFKWIVWKFLLNGTDCQIGLEGFRRSACSFHLVRSCLFGGRVWDLTSSKQLLDKGKCWLSVFAYTRAHNLSLKFFALCTICMCQHGSSLCSAWFSAGFMECSWVFFYTLLVVHINS